MKYCLTFICCLLTITGTCQLTQQLDSFYVNKDYFRLRNTLATVQSQLPVYKQLYYQALTDNAFNRCEHSDRLITQLLDKHTGELTDTMQQQLLITAADNQLKQFQYKKAAYCYHLLTTQYAALADSATLEDFRNSEVLWGAIADIPAQSAVISRDEIIPFHRDQVGLIQFPLTHGQDTCHMIFDTGANLSVITESNAKRLHMKIFTVDLDVNGITGGSVKSSLAVADSLYIGQILLRNIVFLLLPDDMLYFEQLGYRQEGIIGEPVIAQLREVTIGADSTLRVPLHPAIQQYGNLALDALQPVAQFVIGNDSLVFRFDTGATGCVLYAPYFERYKATIMEKGKARALHTAGVGGKVVETQSYRLPDWRISLAGHTVVLPTVDINTAPIGDANDKYYGNLGEDLFKLYHTLTINFESMFLEAH